MHDFRVIANTDTHVNKTLSIARHSQLPWLRVTGACWIIYKYLSRVQVTEATDNFLLVQVSRSCLQASHCLHLAVELESIITREFYFVPGPVLQLVELIGL